MTLASDWSDVDGPEGALINTATDSVVVLSIFGGEQNVVCSRELEGSGRLIDKEVKFFNRGGEGTYEQGWERSNGGRFFELHASIFSPSGMLTIVVGDWTATSHTVLSFA